MRFLPGEPNPSQNALDHGVWDGTHLIVYCSGNNLIIMLGPAELLQTVYLPADGRAVAVNCRDGHVAVGCGSSVVVYKPVPSFSSRLSFTAKCTLDVGSTVSSLSWGEGELLCGTDDSISLWDVGGQTGIWRELLPNEVKNCKFSPDQWLLYSFGSNDRLVKLWQRSSFDPSSVSFDFSYLPHPAPVYWCQWQGVSDEQNSNVLYTFAADRVLRCWSVTLSGSFGLWTSLYCGQGAVPLILDGSKAKLKLPGAAISVFGPQNALTVYSVTDIGSKNLAKLATVKCITKNKKFGLSREFFIDENEPLIPACWPSDENSVQFFARTIKGTLLCLSSPLESAISTSSEIQLPWIVDAVLMGETKSIRHISRSSDGDYMFTQSRFSENRVWRLGKLSGNSSLFKQSDVDMDRGAVLCAALQPPLVILVTAERLVVWNTGSAKAAKVCEVLVSDGADVLCLFSLRSSSGESGAPGESFIFCIYPTKVRAWKLSGTTLVPEDVGFFPGLENTKLLNAATVDPVDGVDRTICSDACEHDAITTYSDQGVINVWAAICVDNKKLLWKLTASFDTKDYIDSEKFFKIKASASRRLAIANKTRLLICNAENGLIELDKDVDDSREQEIRDLDWTRTISGYDLLGVGFASSVTIFCQQRYDYSRKLDVWVPVRSLDISPYTSHPIGDSLWLKDGTFIIGAGNQLFIQDAKVNMSDEYTRQLFQSRNTVSALETAETIFDITAILNGPLPFYHPQFLIQLVYNDRYSLISEILLQLLQKLRYCNIIEPQQIFDIDSYLGFNPLVVVEGNGTGVPTSAGGGGTPHLAGFDTSTVADLQTQLARASLPYLTRHQQVTLLSVIQALAAVSENSTSVDTSGAKFLLGYHLFRLHADSQGTMNMRDFVWGYLSESKPVLKELVLRNMPMTWQTFKTSGIPYWIGNRELKDMCEELAKQTFAKTRDPTAVTLFYLALGKKAVLLSLWRVCASHPEQQKTIRLLSQDFTTPRWREAALKNAYALMSKHRYEYAACFFLLGGAINDACNVLGRQLQDLALTVTVARICQGDDGAAMRYVVERFLTPEENTDTFNLWTASWGYMMVGDTKAAVSATVFKESTRFLHHITDPVLVRLYQVLRKHHQLPTDKEMTFLVKVATLYSRMGCEGIGGYLIANWVFLPPTPLESSGKAASSLGERRRSETDDLRFESTNGTTAAAAPELRPEPSQDKLKAPPQQVMAEPDMSAFDFGF